MSEFEIKYLAEKVHIHRWPLDTPEWSDSTKKQLDNSINKNPEKKKITINEKTIKIENYTFDSISKVGVSVPFFKKECTIIFEAKFEGLFAHVHITSRAENYIDLFNQLISWRNKIFPDI